MGSAWKVVAWRRFEASPEEVWAALGMGPEGTLAPDGPLGSVATLGAGVWRVDPPSRARRVGSGLDQRLRVERAIGDRSRLVVETWVVRDGRFAGWRARWEARRAGEAARRCLEGLRLPGDPVAGVRAHPLPPAMAGHADDALGTLLDVAAR